jgi:hypothetical protein
MLTKNVGNFLKNVGRSLQKNVDPKNVGTLCKILTKKY